MRWRSDRKITVFLDGAKDGGFETTEREVETVDFWHRKLIGFFVTFERNFGNSRTTWVGETENFGDFIKNFADGIVASAADDMKIVVALHIYNLRMAAGNDEIAIPGWNRDLVGASSARGPKAARGSRAARCRDRCGPR